MTLDDILKEWEKDAPINHDNLGEVNNGIPLLHHKYLRLYHHERMVLSKLESDLRVLNLEKWEFFTQGPNEDTKRKGWTLPAKGKIIKSESTSYMDADSDLNGLRFKISYQQEKVGALTEILKSINYRNYVIKNYIEWIKWTGGS